MGKGKEMITLRELKEKAVSKQQQKLMGLALAYKRGDVPDSEVSDTVKDLAKSMSTKELEDFASTKHKGLPQKKEDNEITNRSAAMKPQTYNDPKTGRKKVRMVPVNTNIVKTNDRVDEAKSSTGYELYHRDFSSAMQHAYKHAKAKLGVDVDPDEIWSKVAMGPSKPSKGKTNSYRLLDKGGKKAIQVQVYGMDNGKYELNMYKESVNEAKDPGEYDNEGEMAKNQLQSILRDAEHMIEMFDDEENLPEWVQNKITKAQDYLQSAHSYMMGQDEDDDDDEKEVKEYLEVGTDAIRKSYASMTPGQTNELTGTDKALAVGAVGALAYGAKKVKDRFDPVKVRDARKKRAEKRAERSDAERELAQNRRDHENYQKKLRQMRDKQNQQRNKK
jgi:hypothetical protein